MKNILYIVDYFVTNNKRRKHFYWCDYDFSLPKTL